MSKYIIPFIDHTSTKDTLELDSYTLVVPRLTKNRGHLNKPIVYVCFSSDNKMTLVRRI